MKQIPYDEVPAIHECRPGNMPEDLNENLKVPFIIGDTFEEMCYEYTEIKCHRFCIRKNGTWVGEHPRFWRKMNLAEAMSYTKNFMAYTRGEIEARKRIKK